jgi:hypothetical protein
MRFSVKSKKLVGNCVARFWNDLDLQHSRRTQPYKGHFTFLPTRKGPFNKTRFIGSHLVLQVAFCLFYSEDKISSSPSSAEGQTTQRVLLW